MAICSDVLKLALLFLVLCNFIPATHSVPEVENVYFRINSGEFLEGYLQTVDTRQKTVYCEAVSKKTPAFDIKILFKSPGANLEIIGRSVSFTPPCDLVIQCEAYVQSTDNISPRKRVLLVVKGLPPVRLSGGVRPNEGVLEVLQNGQHWRAVCKDGFLQTTGSEIYTSHNGNVLCKMLGFTGFNNFKEELAFRSEGSGLYPYQFRCLGKENNLHNCPMDSLQSNCTGGKAGIICQASHMTPPKQSLIQVSKSNEINIRMSIQPAKRDIWIGEEVVVSCSLKIQLPRLHLLNIIQKFGDGTRRKLQPNETKYKARIEDRYLDITATYKMKSTLKNMNNSFVCRGIDNISRVLREQEMKVKYRHGISKTRIFPASCTNTESRRIFLCDANSTNPLPVYQWTIVSRSGNKTKRGQQVEIQDYGNVQKLCCEAKQEIRRVIFRAESCYYGELSGRSSSRYLNFKSAKNVVFDTLGYTGRYGIIQHFKPKVSGCYKITAYGAAGGNHKYSSSKKGGRGAKVELSVELQRNKEWTVVIGQSGGDATSSGIQSGGGGASVMYDSDNLLIMAGGGGGAAKSANGKPGTGSNSGSFTTAGGSKSTGGSHGTRYTGGSNNMGGVGAGWKTMYKKTSKRNDGRGGNNREYNWLGGLSGYYDDYNEAGHGGFGGGGGAGNTGCSGGGGGYSGGGSCNHDDQGGGGGGSYCANYTRNCVMTEGGNMERDGKIIIQYLLQTC